ncbi:MAG: type I 3-dehydroquinate dehydratase [Acidobacteria bacterium]|nr:type I 3-dehydroquinate dehydratase [Acidobacteriota bacterium]
MTTAQLCATVTAETTAELRVARDVAGLEADLVELRLDSVRDLDLEGALSGRRTPVLVTCRPRWEGGAFSGSEEERRRILTRALALGAEWVDLEWGADFGSLVADREGRNIVLSSHDFNETPADLEARCEAMRATGAAVVKVAVFSRSARDVVRLLDLGRSQGGAATVLVGMGPIGVPTRVLPARFGSRWTYAGDGVAPGQVSLTDMVRRYRFRTTSASAAVYGVAGRPIGHSLSPPMHNAGLDAADIDAVYVPFEATDADDLMALLTALDVAGVSVTAPFKEAILSHLTEVDELGRQVGAVNTLRRDPDGWSGRNTDVPGFLAPLLAAGGVAGQRAAVVGAGGSARAVAVGLADEGAEVTVCARRTEQAVPVAALRGARVGAFPPPAGSWDLLVNTTPTGTAPRVADSPVPGALLVGGRTVYDLVYNPRRTRLLQDAAAAGCRTIGGLDMLVAQAVRQFEWWFGTRPSSDLFMTAALAALGAQGEEYEA